MVDETVKERAQRILAELKSQYPGKKCYDLDGRGLHFVCEAEPVEKHPEYDRAIEVIIQSKPHKHLKMRQVYTILTGNLKLHDNNDVIQLHPGDKYTIEPGHIHWAESDDECREELHSQPGWTKEDHIFVENNLSN